MKRDATVVTLTQLLNSFEDHKSYGKCLTFVRFLVGPLWES